MITLNKNKEYYILSDLEGGTFGGGRIFEGIEELIDFFQNWADHEDFEDPTLSGYTLAELMDIWNIDILIYDEHDFRHLIESEQDYKVDTSA